MATVLEDGEDLLLLRACYQAFLQRRIERGGLSVRTRQGYERLRQKYQPRVRFLQHEAPGKDDAATETLKGATTASPSKEKTDAKSRETHVVVDQLGGDEKDPKRSDLEPLFEGSGTTPEPTYPPSDNDSEGKALRHFVGVFFDARVKRMLLETLWPLAHHGGRPDGMKSVLPPVPEWQELEQHKYYTLMLKAVMWLFPGVLAYEAQEHAERDWRKDCEFDAYGTHGLSFEGFMVSMLDLAVSCTDGSVGNCIEFFTHLTKRLEISLPIFRVPTGIVLRTIDGEDEGERDTFIYPRESIVWRTIQLEQLFPCSIRARPQYLELKTRLTHAPVMLMILAGNDRPIELQISTSAKLLVRERNHRQSVRRNTMQANALSHFIEIEKQYMWTYRSFPGRPTLLVIPSAVVSRRSMALYACCRRLESYEHTIEETNEASNQADPLMTFFTSVNEPIPLFHGRDKSLCGRIDRQSGRLFIVNRRDRTSNIFSITFKTSLIHNVSSAGGAGAAAVLASVQYLESTGTANCKSELIGCGVNANTTPHSFIFVVKGENEFDASNQHSRSRKNGDAHVPSQWFTTLCGSNENKTIFIDSSAHSSMPSDSSGTNMSGMYYIYVFTIHGFYFEAIYEDCDLRIVPTSSPTDERDGIVNTVADRDLWRHERSERLTHQSDPLKESGGQSIALRPDDHATDSTVMASISKHPTSVSSTTLLRHLLLLRKRRGENIDAPPQCLGGSKITSMRILTSAAGLRAKFLRARAAERRARLQQNDEAFRTKVLARLLKAEEKKRTQRCGYTEPTTDNTSVLEAGNEPQILASSELEMKATVLVNFFREMAMYHPTQKEIENCLNPSQMEKEDELLEHFADLFNNDHALHNILDAEKWLTSEAKTEMRQSILHEHMEQRRRTLVEMNRGQVSDLLRDSCMAPNDAEDGRKLDRASHQQRQVSEDYESTAALIQRLMREVAEEEERKGDGKENMSNGDEISSDDLGQVVASWVYASRTHSPRAPSASRQSHFERLEAVRRDEWMKSKYIHDEGLHERLTQRRQHLRATLTPSVQHMDNQTHDFSWQPVWDASQDLGTQASGNQECGEDQDVELKVSTIKQRPTTASVNSYVPRPPSSTVFRNATEAATHAAVLSRIRARRIRSATAGTPSTASKRPTSGRGHFVRLNHAEQPIPIVSQALLHEPYSAIMRRIGGEYVDDTNTPHDCSRQEEEHVQPQLPGIQVESEASAPRAPDTLFMGNSNTPATRKTASVTKRDTKKKKKRMSPAEKRFTKRVEELLAISPVIQQSMLCEKS